MIRRDFIKNISVSLLVASVLPPLLRARAKIGSEESPLAVQGKEGMIVRSLRFLDLEMPPEYANSWITPAEHFFVRNHMFEPTTVNPRDWRLTVSGEVENPLTLSLADLTKLEQHSIVNTLECAGNGRAFHNPKVPGIQWQRGAVGTARFTGPTLASVLQPAGVKKSGKHVMFRGLDQAPGQVPPFIRSIPIEKATDPDTLVATHMNRAPLPKHHGFPARALVPGWIGAASCKWLTEIKILDQEFEGNFMKPGYRYPNQSVAPGETVPPENTHPLTALTVKSLIASPVEGARVRGRVSEIHGVAWAGEADVVKVEVSTDGGASWAPAVLGKEQSRYAWRLWTHRWQPSKSGDYVVMSRATDSRGRVQPETAAWNPSGYLYNAIDKVHVYVQI
jgi:DMSO/TMAO reductase YedYZ molybdopterin-dependent catalytic subunit